MAFNPNRVLLADDEQRPRELLGNYLTRWGYNVTFCADGLEAARILEGENPPSLALVDWMMPGLEGIEICRRVRNHPERRPYTYLILVTGHDAAARGLEAGADDFVSKPYDLDELRARLAVGQRVVTLERRLAEHIGQLRGALDQLSQTRDEGGICVCPRCRRMRDSLSGWQSIEGFVRERTGISPTPETCPECRDKAAS